MRFVVRLSKGVVSTAAVPPAKAPHSARCRNSDTPTSSSEEKRFLYTSKRAI